MLIAIDMIEIGTRVRGADPEQVAAIAASVAEVGLLSPITVYERQVVRAGIAEAGWGIVAGLHRLEACRSLGLVDIEANVVSLGELDRQIAECDENLCGTKLSPAQRAMFTQRRKDAYEAKHPETRNGANQHTRVSQLEKPSPAFVQDTATKTGQGRSTVARDASRGERITDDVLDDVAGTELDKGVWLDEIAQAPRDAQADKVQEIKRRIEDRKLVQKGGDELVTRDGADDAAQMIIDYVPEFKMQEMLNLLDAAGATRVSKAIRRAIKTETRLGSDQAVFDNTRAGAA